MQKWIILCVQQSHVQDSLRVVLVQIVGVLFVAGFAMDTMIVATAETKTHRYVVSV